MKSKYFAAALAATCLTSTVAYAQDTQPTGLYVGVNAGVAQLDDVDVTYFDVGGTLGGTGAQDTLDAELDFKKALTLGGVFGYDFGVIRTDIEVSYARNKVRSIEVENLNGAPVTLTPADRQDVCDFAGIDPCTGTGNSFRVDGGKVRQLNGMANVWVDLPLGPINPYVGGGVGLANFEVADEDKTRFAWQLGAGAAFQLTPGLALTADYRHREARRTNLDFGDGSGFRIGKLKTDTLTAGLRFYFGGPREEMEPAYAPPPPPAYTPPPPAPEPVYTPPPAPTPDPRVGERG